MQSKEKNLSNEIYHATKWSAITNIMRKMISPLTNMVLARILAPDAFGVVATITMVITFAEIFADAGFQKYLVQHEFKDEKDLFDSATVAFWTNMVITVVLFGIIAIFRENIATLVGSAGYGFHLMIAAFSIPLVSLSSIQQALFRRRFDFKGMFLARLVNALVPLFVTIPLAYVTKSCWALIVGTLCSNMMDVILLTIKSKWKPRLYYKMELLKEMFSFSWWTLLESLSIWVTTNIDIFIIGQILSDHYLGLYKTSIVTIDQITNLITTTIVPVLFAALSRYQNDNKMFSETVYSFQKKSALILVPMSVGMYIYGDVVTWILLGNQWKEAAGFISLLGAVQVIRVLYAKFASEVYRAKGEPLVSFVVQILYIILIVPTIYITAKTDFEALYISRVILMVCFVLMHMTVMKIRYKLSIRTMLSAMVKPGIAALIMGVVAYVMHSNIESMLIKVASIAVCVVVYGVVCLASPDMRKMLLSFKGNKE